MVTLPPPFSVLVHGICSHEKDVGMGLCMFNFVIHLVSVLFGTSIPTSFYIFWKIFFCTLYAGM